jgi:hypothetical protein
MIFGRFIESGAAAQTTVSTPPPAERDRTERPEPARVRVSAPGPVQPQQT